MNKLAIAAGIVVTLIILIIAVGVSGNSTSSPASPKPQYKCDASWALDGTRCLQDCKPGEVDHGLRCEIPSAEMPWLTVPSVFAGINNVLVPCPSGTTKSGSSCYKCPAGYVFKNGICAKCSEPGYNIGSATCQRPAAYYDKKVIDAGSSN